MIQTSWSIDLDWLTLIDWPWSIDLDRLTLIDWSWSIHLDRLTLINWPWLIDLDQLTLINWPWSIDLDQLTLIHWPWSIDLDPLTLIDWPCRNLTWLDTRWYTTVRWRGASVARNKSTCTLFCWKTYSCSSRKDRMISWFFDAKARMSRRVEKTRNRLTVLSSSWPTFSRGVSPQVRNFKFAFYEF